MTNTPNNIAGEELLREFDRKCPRYAFGDLGGSYPIVVHRGDAINFVQEAYEKGKKAGVIEQMQASADAFPALKEKIIQEAIAGERKRILQSVNDSEKLEQILGTLLVRLIGGEGELEIKDVDIVTSDWVVFQHRNPGGSSTRFKVIRNQLLQ